MKKVAYRVSLNYEYHQEHKGAPYLIDNKKWANAGELTESIMKHQRGLDYLVNPATRYDNGSDIEEERASVKSGGASLGCIYSNDFDEIIRIYFENVHSKVWYYGIMIEDTMVEYHMNAKEFEKFLYEFGGLAKESHRDVKKIRIKKTSTKMIKWLEGNL